MNSLSQFLRDYPGMSTAPCKDAGVCLRGKFRFKASESGGDEIDDSYKLEIVVPEKFPQAIPKVKETGGSVRSANCTQYPATTRIHGTKSSDLVSQDAVSWVDHRFLKKVAENPPPIGDSTNIQRPPFTIRSGLYRGRRNCR